MKIYTKSSTLHVSISIIILTVPTCRSIETVFLFSRQ